MKRLAIILLGIFVLTLFPVLPAEASGEGNKGTVWRDQYGNFDSIQWQIITRGGSGTRYRVIERQVTIDGHTASFSPTPITPKPGETIMQTVTIDAAELASKMGVSPQEVEGWMNSGAVAQVSVKVQIIDKDDNVLGTYEDYGSLAKAMGKVPFPQIHIDQVKSLWGDADDPDRPELKNLSAAIQILDMQKNPVSSLKTGQQYLVQGTFYNSASVICENAQLRVYYQGQNDSDMRTLGSSPANIPAGHSIIREWPFTASSGKNSLTVSINKSYTGYGGWLNERFESKGKTYPETTWEDNRANLTLNIDMSESITTKEPEKLKKLYDLVAESAQVVDSNGKTVSSIEIGRSVHVEATFVSNFIVSGNATIRLYECGKNFKLLHETPVFFESGPGRVLTYKWPSYTVSNIENQFFITIDIAPDGTHEFFDGKYDENNWNNNAAMASITASEIPIPDPPPPPPSMYFPEWTDGHWERRTVTRDVQGWKEVRVNLPEKPKVKTRLIK